MQTCAPRNLGHVCRSRPQLKFSTGCSRRSFSTRGISLTDECPSRRTQAPSEVAQDGAGDTGAHRAQSRIFSTEPDLAQSRGDPPALHQHAPKHEQLARNCVCEQREVTQIWAARGTRTFAIKIRMAPTYSKSYAMAVLSPCRPARQIPPKAIGETARQLNLFDRP
jgi:hypothetical protein